MIDVNLSFHEKNDGDYYSFIWLYKYENLYHKILIKLSLAALHKYYISGSLNIKEQTSIMFIVSLINNQQNILLDKINNVIKISTDIDILCSNYYEKIPNIGILKSGKIDCIIDDKCYYHQWPTWIIPNWVVE